MYIFSMYQYLKILINQLILINWTENICWYEWRLKQYYIFNVSVILISVLC